MKRSKPLSSLCHPSRLWLESLDERVVPSRSSWIGLDLGLTDVQVSLTDNTISLLDDDRGKGDSKTESKKDSEKQETKVKGNSGNGSSSNGRWSSRVLSASYYGLDDLISTTTNAVTNTTTTVHPAPTPTTSQVSSGSYVLEEVTNTETTNPTTEPETERVPVKTVETMTNTTKVVQDIKTIREAKVTPLPERIDEPKQEPEVPPVRPPLVLPTVERTAEAVPAVRTAIDANGDDVRADDEQQSKPSQPQDDAGAVTAELSMGTFVIINAGPTLAAAATAPAMVALEGITESFAPAAVQAAGAVAQFAPFDPAALQNSIENFIDSLRTKNLDEGSSFGVRQFLVLATSLLGTIVSGELMRRKRIVKRSREWLSTTLSKWLTLPVKE